MDFFNGKIKSLQQKLQRNRSHTKLREESSQNDLNTDFESDEELKQIYLLTFDTKLRTLLHEDLKGRRYLTEENLADYAFAKKLQELYASENDLTSSVASTHSGSVSNSSSLTESFSHSSSLSGSFSRSSELCPAELRPRSSGTGKRKHKIVASVQDQNAICTLEHVRSWDEQRRQLIVLDGAYISNAEVAISQYSHELWSYLISHNHLALVRRWMENFVSSDLYFDQIQQLPENLSLEDFISVETRDILLRFLVKIGYYPEFILNDFRDFLSSLCTVKSLFDKTHPMENFRKEMPDETRKSLINKFNNNFLRFCQDEQMMMLLWHYGNQFNLSLSSITTKDQMSSWISLLLSFRDVAVASVDCSERVEVLLLKAFCENSRFLVHRSVCFEEEYAISDMLQNNQIIQALSSFLICQNRVTENVLKGNSFIYGMDKELLKTCLQPHPSLHQAATGPPVKTQPTQSTTMYQLLHNFGINISRCFLWQHTNSFRSLEDSVVPEFPHFSSASLTQKFETNFFQDYEFHLEQNRPVLAYIVYSSRKGLSESLLMLKTYTYAMQHFTEPCVVGSCSLFLALLGIRNDMLNIDVAAACTIVNHYGNIALNERKLTLKELHQFLLDAYVFKKEPERLGSILKLLEDATEVIIQKNDINKISYDAIWCWQLVLSFCRIHNLPLSTRFIENCCKVNDWLHLFVFLHFYQVPSEHVIPTLEKFMKNTSLRGHLITILRTTPTTHNRKDNAVALHNNVHSRKLSNANCEKSPITFLQPSSLPEILQNVPEDIIDVILQCEEQVNSWRALLDVGLRTSDEVYAILATCCDGADMIACQAVWCICAISAGDTYLMLKLCKAVFGSKLIDLPPRIPADYEWKLLDLLPLLDVALDYGIVYVKLLIQGFRIFGMDDINIHMLEFFHEFLCEKETSGLVKKLSHFQSAFEKLLPSDRTTFPEQMSFRIVRILINQRSDIVRLRKLVDVLIESNYGHLFFTPLPDFVLLKKTLNLIYNGEILYPFEQVFTTDEELLSQHASKIFELLLNKGSFDQASSLAQLYSLPQKRIPVQKVMKELKEIEMSDSWKEISIRQAFIDKSDNIFLEHKCCCELAGGFFEEQALSGRSFYTNSEKCNLLMLAVQWFHKSGIIGAWNERVDELQTEVWRFRIKAEVDLQNGIGEGEPNNIFEVGKKAGADASDDRVSSLQQTCSDIIMPQYNDDNDNGSFVGSCEFSLDVPVLSLPLTQEEWLVYDAFIGKLLDKSLISEARKAAHYFQRTTRDLEIVLAAISLAHGNETVDDLSDNIKSILAATTTNHVTLNTLLQSNGKDALQTPVVPSGGCINEFIFVEEVENALEKLLLHVRYGVKPLQCIVACFKTAALLQIPYEAVVLNEVFVNLRQILDTSKDLKQELAKEFINAFALPVFEVDNFVADTMINWIEMSCGIVDNVLSEDTSEPYSLSLYHSAEKILSLLQLADDHSKIGDIILQEVMDLRKSDVYAEVGTNPHQLSCEVELLFYTHQAYSTCCDIVKIGKVLHEARVTANKLEKMQLYEQLARLTAGIGRFPEMSYTIGKMYEDQQLLILCKEVKEDSLKRSLLEFLIAVYPNDHKTIHAVARRFQLHRELAEYYEAAGMEAINIVKYDVMNANLLNNNNKDFVVSLINIRNVFLYAAENYLKEDCVSNAQRCTRLARLVEVQAQLPTGVCVLGLSNESVVSFLLKHKNFLESYMVADSYELPIPACFVEPLFHNVVLNGNRVYLEEFMKYFRLTPTIISQVAGFYQRPREIGTEVSPQNMEHLLSKLYDVRTKRNLAREMGFHETEGRLLEGSAGAYSRDFLI